MILRIIAALYIDPRGPYPKLPGVDAWLVAIARTADLSRPFRREPRQIGLFGEGLAAQ